jgi:hypothetical protein
MFPIHANSPEQGGWSTEPECSSQPGMVVLPASHNLLLRGQYLDNTPALLMFYELCVLRRDFTVTLVVTPVLF